MIKKYFIFLVVFVIYIPYVFSFIEIRIDVRNESRIGDAIVFNYTIISTLSELPSHVVWVNCPNAPLPLLQLQPTDLKKDGSLDLYIYQNTYTYLTVDEKLEPQQCKAEVSLYNYEQDVKGYAEFSIITDPSFNLDIEFCKDSACTKKSKIFLLKETVYIDYVSSTQNPDIKAILISPDRASKSIETPNSIIAEQIGTYILKVTASKQGYKTITKEEMFGVIEKHADIKPILTKPTEKPKPVSNSLIIGIIILIIIFGYIIIHEIRIRRQNR